MPSVLARPDGNRRSQSEAGADAVQEEVLARLLGLNAERARAEARSGAGAAGMGRGRRRAAKLASMDDSPRLFS